MWPVTTALFVLVGKHLNSRSQMFYKADALKNFCYIHRKTPVLEILFNKLY